MEELIEELAKTKSEGFSALNLNSVEIEEGKPGSTKASRQKEVAVEVAWQQLAAEPLYILELEITTGVKQSLAIAGEDLCLDVELVEGLVGGYRSKISKQLVKLRGKLESMQKAFYRKHTIYAAPFRFVREESLTDAITHIEEMQTQAAEYCQELSEDYAEQVSSFLLDISARLHQAIPEDDCGA